MALRGILDLHRQAFAPMERPAAPPPQPVDVAPIRKMLRKQNLVGVGVFALAARKAAKAEADEAARVLAGLQFADRQLQHDERDRELGEWWAKLLDNDPAITGELLNQAFEDNEAPSAVLSIEGDEASIVVLVDDESVIPEKCPSTTPAGNLSLRRMTKTERAGLYREVVCGSTLTTIREALAVAPGIGRVRIVAIRTTGTDAFGAPRAEALLAARFSRGTLAAVRWDDVEASTIVHDTADELLVNYRGVARTVAPLDLAKEPDVARLVSSVDFEVLG